MSDKVINKIQHLLNTTTANGASEEESQSALLKAQKLLAKHSLSMADINVSVGEDQKGEVNKARTESQTASWWARNLAYIIAENFRCYHYIQKSYFDKKNSERFTFIGKNDDAEIASTVFSYAYNAIHHFSKKYIKRRKAEDLAQQGYNFKTITDKELSRLASSCVPMNELVNIDVKYKDNPKIRKMRLVMAIKKHLGLEFDTTAIKNDYISGFLVGLKSQFDKQKEENKEEWGLVLVKDEDLTEYFENLNLKNAKHKKVKRKFDAGAWSQGQEQGENWKAPIGGLE